MGGTVVHQDQDQDADRLSDSHVPAGPLAEKYSPNMDVRVAKTRDLLSAAILELVASKPIAQITVVDVTRHAGVNRATFYDHFKSPSQLLAKTLAADFGAMRKEYLRLHRASSNAEEALRQGLSGLIDHVEERRWLYERTLTGTATPDVVSIFVQAFELACFNVLTEIARQRLTRAEARTVAAFAAAGAVGAVGLWLEDGQLDKDELIETLVATFPHWWRDAPNPSQPLRGGTSATSQDLRTNSTPPRSVSAAP